MNFYLKWAKSNLIVVIVFVIALAAIPVGYVISSGMNEGIKSQVETQVRGATSSLEGINTSYELPGYAVGGETWSYSGAPNAELNARYEERRQAIVSQIGGLQSWLENFNRNDLEPVIPELFPVPEGGESGPNNRTELSTRMIERYPQELDRILEENRVRPAPDPQTVIDQLNRARNIEVNRRLADRVEQRLTPDELQQIEDILIEARLALYRETASQTAFYGRVGVFDMAYAHEQYENGPPTRSAYQSVFWQWQHTLWAYESIVEALARVNEDWGGNLLQGPMKRVLSIDVEPYPTTEVSNPGDFGSAVQPNFENAFTGRVPGASFYDIREATIEFIASAGGLNEVIDAVQSASFIAVTDLDYSDYNPENDLDAGYYYGEEALVRGRMTIQTIWIRSWYEDLIPPDVRTPMGLPELQPEDEGDDAESNDTPDGSDDQ